MIFTTLLQIWNILLFLSPVGVGSRGDYLNHTYLESCRIFSETSHHAVTKGE